MSHYLGMNPGLIIIIAGLVLLVVGLAAQHSDKV